MSTRGMLNTDEMSFIRAKTLFQLLLAATVANLTLVATKMRMISPGPGSSHDKPGQQAPGSPSLLPNSYWPQPTGVPLAYASDLAQSTGYPPTHLFTTGPFLGAC